MLEMIMKNKLMMVAGAVASVAFTTLFPGAGALALTADQSALVGIANQYVTHAPGSSQAYISGMAIYGTWALIGWTDNTNSAGEIVASKASGSWAQVRGAGGQYNASELQSLTGMDSTTATFLVTNFRPLPPVVGTTQDASGSLTYQAYTQKCTGAGFGSYTTDDIPPPLIATPSIAPTSLSQAVTIDVTPSAGQATVTLLSPTNQVLAQTTLQAGQTGGVGYWNPLAPTGSYSVLIAGTHTGNSDTSCSGTIVSKQTRVDTTWAGTLAW